LDEARDKREKKSMMLPNRKFAKGRGRTKLRTIRKIMDLPNRGPVMSKNRKTARNGGRRTRKHGLMGRTNVLPKSGIPRP